MDPHPSRKTPTRQSGLDGDFPPTRWSLVLRARQLGDAHAEDALAELCRAYWKPIYLFLRRQGHNLHDAEDLTQGFFVMLLERDSLADVAQSKGRLRSFFLVAVKRLAINEHERARTLKRGAGARHFALNGQEAECCPSALISDETPDRFFERQWALSLLEAVLTELQREYHRSGRERIFEALKDKLSAEPDDTTLAATAVSLGMTEGAVKVAVHRIRRRYRRILRAEIARTVESPEEIETEIAHLFKAFRI